MPPRIVIDRRKTEGFCIKWKIAEFALFGSVLREDFGGDSDVDVLVSFRPGGASPLRPASKCLTNCRVCSAGKWTSS
jgi:hypothetical protein